MARIIRNTTTTKTAAASDVADAKEKLHTEAAHEAFENEGNAAFSKFRAAAEEYAQTLPSSNRIFFSWVLGLLAAGGTGYLIGSMVWPILDALFIAVAATTTSMFLAWIIYTLGILLMAWSAWHAGGYIGTKVSNYIIEGKPEQHFKAAKNWVTGLFSSKTPVTEAR